MPPEPCGMGQEGAGSWEMGLGQAQNPCGSVVLDQATQLGLQLPLQHLCKKFSDS